MEKRSIMIYADAICKIGGIETWLYNLTEILKDDFFVTVLYSQADPMQLSRLSVPACRYENGKSYVCDVLLNNIDGRPNSVRAGHIIQMVHANYAQIDSYRYHHWNRVDSLIFVSEAARDNFTHRVTPDNHVVLANPLAEVEIPKKKKKKTTKLTFLAATRLTSEKGGRRIADFVRKLDGEKLDFDFHIWTTWQFKNFVRAYNVGAEKRHLFFHEPKLDLKEEMAEADYVCQFSDCESFCYTIHEALSVHTPVLVTDWDGVRKVVRNGLNGYILDMGLNNLSIEKIKKIPHTFGVLPNDNKLWIRHLNNVPILHSYRRPYNMFLN